MKNHLFREFFSLKRSLSELLEGIVSSRWDWDGDAGQIIWDLVYSSDMQSSWSGSSVSPEVSNVTSPDCKYYFRYWTAVWLFRPLVLPWGECWVSALECNYSLESLIFTLVSHNSILFIIFLIATHFCTAPTLLWYCCNTNSLDKHLLKTHFLIVCWCSNGSSARD